MEPLRFGTLKAMARSAAHARYVMERGIPDTPSMRMGRLAHAVFLGERMPTVFEGERRGNVWKDFKTDHAGEDIVTSKEFQNASDMAAALHVHPEARKVLMGKRERTVLFRMNGRDCRVTLDVLGSDFGTELKTTADANPMRFPYLATRLAYQAQLAWSKDGILEAKAGNPERLFVVAIEPDPPYAICVYQLTERAEDFGRRQYRTWLEGFLNCERSNAWPGYVPAVLDAPEEAVRLIGSDGEPLEGLE